MKASLTYTTPLIPGIEALSCANDFEFEHHLHTGHVLWLNSEGGEQYFLKGHSEILQPGSISVIEPGVVHANRPYNNEVRHLRSLYLNRTFFSYLEQLFTGSPNSRFNLSTTVFSDKRLWQKAIMLHESIITKQCRLLTDELLISLFSKLGDSTFWKGADFGQTTNSHLDRVIEYMRAAPEKDHSLRTLANLAGYTSFHLIRLFKNNIGLPPHSYLIQLRLEKARELLDKGNDISDAALMAGFSDQSHLTRRFKKRYGLTPGAYLSQKRP